MYLNKRPMQQLHFKVLNIFHRIVWRFTAKSIWSIFLYRLKIYCCADLEVLAIMSVNKVFFTHLSLFRHQINGYSTPTLFPARQTLYWARLICHAKSMVFVKFTWNILLVHYTNDLNTHPCGLSIHIIKSAGLNWQTIKRAIKLALQTFNINKVDSG